MAGPWERYQQPSAAADPTASGPWTQYQSAAPEADFSDVSVRVAPSLAERYKAAGINPNVKATDGESFLDNAAAGFGASYVDTKDAVRQLASQGAADYTRGVQAIQGAGLPAPQFAKEIVQGLTNATSGYEKKVQSEIDQRKKYDEALKDTGAGKIGGGLGFISQLLMPAGTLRGIGTVGGGAVNALAALGSRALLPATLRGSALQGAALGALTPVATGDSRGANALLGGVAGAGGAALGRAIGATARGTKNALLTMLGRPTQNALAERVAQVLRAEAELPERLMQAAPSAISRVQRTLAEEVLDPGVARLERLLRGKGGSWGDLDRANNNARVNALAAFAGDDAAIAAAKRQRGDSAKPLLERALEVENVDTKPVANALRDLAEKSEGRPAVQDGLSRIGSLLQRTAPGAEKGAEKVAENRLSVLYNVRKTIDDMLSGKYGGESAAALAGSRELLKVKESLDEALASASPEFAQYLDAFRKGSIPIGRMQIGRELMERGGAVPDAVSGSKVLTPAQFSKATSNMDRVAAKATGFNKAEASRYLEPEDMATINAIQDDLQRRSFAATAGSGGNSQTAERLMGDDRLSRGLVSRAAERIPVFGAAAQYLRDAGQQRLEAKLAEVMMNPAQARSILAAVPAEDRRVLQLALGRVGNAAGAVAANSMQQ
ncbi:hypothetical protein [Lysobacter capsici]|uniref:hypothetical protein n=1 Tax=Lysobacter capsici TaxID=435897 RepID=UPI001BFFF46C|nr:hypothetical protein [Lysobacter capsici]QWF19303.1 hypothetical protein KME82_11460 [Lysobacter capsici]